MLTLFDLKQIQHSNTCGGGLYF